MPLANPDFVPFLQRAKDAKPDAVFAFVPVGKQATALMKAFGDLGLTQAGIKLIGPGDIVTDEELQGMGDVAIGTITMHHYSVSRNRPANQAFVAAYKKRIRRERRSRLRGGGCAMTAWRRSSHVVIAQKGNIDPDRTMELLKGWKDTTARAGRS